MVTNSSPLGLIVAARASGSISSKVFPMLPQSGLEIMPNISLKNTEYKNSAGDSGDTATVTFQITIKAESQAATTVMTMQLIKEDGKWEVEPIS